MGAIAIATSNWTKNEVYGRNVTKSFLNESKCMKGWDPHKLDGNDTTTLSLHPYTILLCHLAAAYTDMLVLVLCIGGLLKTVDWVVLSV